MCFFVFGVSEEMLSIHFVFINQIGCSGVCMCAGVCVCVGGQMMKWVLVASTRGGGGHSVWGVSLSPEDCFVCIRESLF